MEKTFGYYIIAIISYFLLIVSSGCLVYAYFQSGFGSSMVFWMVPVVLSLWTVVGLHQHKWGNVITLVLLTLIFAIAFVHMMIIPTVVELGILMLDRSTRAYLK